MFNVNHGSCRVVRQSIACGLLVCSALAALALPIRARAEFLGRASASGQFESNSNVFDLDSGFVPSGTFSKPPADNYFAYGAELDGIYLFGRQQIYARLDTKEYNYQRFKELNHTEYDVVTRFIWKLGDRLDGIVGVIRTHSMTPFLDLARSELTLSVGTQQKESATFNAKLSSKWVLQGGAARTESNQPVRGSPDLQNTETSGTATLNYVGAGRLTSGLTAGYASGGFSGSSNNPNPSYSQSQAGFASSFKSGRTMYEGQIGYTTRSSSSGNDKTAGLTGKFDFTYQLTPKTACRVKVSRAVNSYILNTGSELDTDAGAGLSWRASYKLSVAMDYTYGYRDYSGQGLDPANAKRIDHQQYANLALVYQPQRWVLIRPYANFQTRRSSAIGRNSDSTIYGVSVTVMTSDQATANSVPMETHWR